MTKTELRAAYEKVRQQWGSGQMFNNEYALHLDAMLSRYFSLPLLDPVGGSEAEGDD